MPQAPDSIDYLQGVSVYDQPMTVEIEADITVLGENAVAWTSYDWSGVSVSYLGAATMITENYAVVANHAPGTTYKWLGRNGVEYASGRDSLTQIAGTDLAVIKITSPPPLAQVARYSIPDRIADWAPCRIMWMERARTIQCLDCEQLTSGLLTWDYPIFPATSVVVGDSSKPVFVAYENQLLVLGCHSTILPNRFPAISEYITEINTAIAPDTMNVVDPDFATVLRTAVSYAEPLNVR